MNKKIQIYDRYAHQYNQIYILRLPAHRGSSHVSKGITLFPVCVMSREKKCPKFNMSQITQFTLLFRVKWDKWGGPSNMWATFLPIKSPMPPYDDIIGG